MVLSAQRLTLDLASLYSGVKFVYTVELAKFVLYSGVGEVCLYSGISKVCLYSGLDEQLA